MAASLAVLPFLPGLRGPYVIPFLACYLLTAIAYTISVSSLKRSQPSLTLVWGFAILLRLLLLATSPSLSDDVYRYIWDGHLLNQGVNPYALPVADPALDLYDTPLRFLVNHAWMASPYLPAAQLLFAAVDRLAAQSALAYQALMALLDLSCGWLVMDLLRRLALPPQRALIYLWNPLVIVEFAHGAHVDAWMIFLSLLAFWLALRAGQARKEERWRLSSALALAAAALTKGMPLLLAPLFLQRWGWRGLVVFIAAIGAAIAPFAANAGWGLSGALDGRGLFGALRIYATNWNYNSGFYHWLEVGLSGYQTPGAVPLDATTSTPIWIAKFISSGLILLTALGAGIWAWRLDDPDATDHTVRTLGLLRLAILPIGGYLLFTTTVHPWYATFIVAFIPFLLPRSGETSAAGRFLWPWLYFSLVVPLSYLTYLDLQNLREYYLVRQIEYLPLYLLLVWAAWPFIKSNWLRIASDHRDPSPEPLFAPAESAERRPPR
jgi:hypothetical protein